MVTVNIFKGLYLNVRFPSFYAKFHPLLCVLATVPVGEHIRRPFTCANACAARIPSVQRPTSQPNQTHSNTP
jgi:hypothetical protein